MRIFKKNVQNLLKIFMDNNFSEANFLKYMMVLSGELEKKKTIPSISLVNRSVLVFNSVLLNIIRDNCRVQIFIRFLGTNF